MRGRKIAFVLGVAGISLLANFALELAAAKLPSEGLRRFVNFVHCGPGGNQ
jgi:hypothetical protein